MVESTSAAVSFFQVDQQRREAGARGEKQAPTLFFMPAPARDGGEVEGNFRFVSLKIGQTRWLNNPAEPVLF